MYEHKLKLGQIISIKDNENHFANRLLMYAGEGSEYPIFMDINGKREPLKLDHTNLFSIANVDSETYDKFESILNEFLNKTQSLINGLKTQQPFELEEGQYIIQDGRYVHITKYPTPDDLKRLKQDGLMRSSRRVKELKDIRSFNRLQAFVAMKDKDYVDGDYQVVYNNTAEKWESAKYDGKFFQPGVVMMSQRTSIELADVLNRQAFVL